MAALVGVVRPLLLYTIWADRRCLQAVEPVRPEDLSRETGTSFGSLLGTLGHILGAERIWLARFEGRSLDPFPTPHDHGDLPGLTAAWQETSAELGFLLAGLTEEQLNGEITWTNSQGVTSTRPLWQLTLHLANHSSYHRGQVISLLRQLGYGALSTDFVLFLREQSA